jgi:hypothetical protein
MQNPFFMFKFWFFNYNKTLIYAVCASLLLFFNLLLIKLILLSPLTVSYQARSSPTSSKISPKCRQIKETYLKYIYII